jgi:hypothetical protein
MPHADLPSCRDGFFERFLSDLPGTPTLATLEQQQASQPLVLLGDYVEYSAIRLNRCPMHRLRPQFAIRTGAEGAHSDVRVALGRRAHRRRNRFAGGRWRGSWLTSGHRPRRKATT